MSFFFVLSWNELEWSLIARMSTVIEWNQNREEYGESQRVKYTKLKYDE